MQKRINREMCQILFMSRISVFSLSHSSSILLTTYFWFSLTTLLCFPRQLWFVFLDSFALFSLTTLLCFPWQLWFSWSYLLFLLNCFSQLHLTISLGLTCKCCFVRWSLQTWSICGIITGVVLNYAVCYSESTATVSHVTWHYRNTSVLIICVNCC